MMRIGMIAYVLCAMMVFLRFVRDDKEGHIKELGEGSTRLVYFIAFILSIAFPLVPVIKRMARRKVEKMDMRLEELRKEADRLRVEHERLMAESDYLDRILEKVEVK